MIRLLKLRTVICEKACTQLHTNLTLAFKNQEIVPHMFVLVFFIPKLWKFDLNYTTSEMLDKKKQSIRIAKLGESK